MVVIVVVRMGLADIGSMGVQNSAARLPELAAQPFNHIIQADFVAQIGKNKRPGLAHAARVAVHHFQGSADIGGEVNFIDNQQIGAGDAWPAFARDFIAPGHIYNINENVYQVGAESRCQIIAATFDKDQFAAEL